ncbi:MAG: PorV/PorQ family protein [Candidatus Eisenbacteria bacterium]|nr:PorV/PorQ family protein [Candidatus Eisenbacteria bacterium]
MRNRLAAAFVGLLLVHGAAHGTEIFAKVGTIGAQFLKIGVGGRGVAMGESFVAIADDASALYWNPAGIARLEGQSHVFFSHSAWPADIGHEFAGYVFTYGGIPGVMGVSLNVLQMDPMIRTTEYHPDGRNLAGSQELEQFDAGDMAIGVSYARFLTDKFAFGGTLKWIHQGLEDEFAEGLNFDFGTLYNTGFRTVTIGMTVQNIGPTMKFIDQEFSPPTTFKLGVAMDAFRSAQHAVLTSAEFNHPSDNKERANLGLEYEYIPLERFSVALRGGYMTNRDIQDYALGFGVGFPTSATATADVNYSFMNMKELGATHQVSVILSY